MRGWKWWRSALTTASLGGLGTFSFWRAADATWEHSMYMGIGAACIALTIHRFAILSGNEKNHE